MMRFFALLYFAIVQTVFICVHTIVCVLGLLVFLIFSTMHIYYCLSYVLQLFCELFVFFFLPNYSNLYFLLFWQANLGTTSSIYEGFCRFRSCFIVLQFVGSLHCANLPFALFSCNNFNVLLRSFCDVILCCDFVRSTPNLIACFAFFGSSFAFVFLVPCLFISTLAHTLLTFPQFLIMIRNYHRDRHCSLSVFFDHLHAVQNTYCGHI